MLLEPTHHAEVRLDPEQMGWYDEGLTEVRRNGRPGLSIGGRHMAGAACWWDPAFGRPDRGDRSVAACVLTDAQGRYWLHDIAYITFDPSICHELDEASQLCRQVVEFCRRNHQNRITVENNGIGRFLPGLLRREARRMSSQITVLEAHSSYSKARRILEAFDPVLSAGHLWAHRRVWETEFVSEMREWRADGRSTDDGLDAVASCLRSQPVRLSNVPRGALVASREPHSQHYRANTTFTL